MATIHCKNDPGLWGWGAEEETEAVLFGASEISLPLFHTNENLPHKRKTIPHKRKTIIWWQRGCPIGGLFYVFMPLRFHARLRAPRRLATTAKAPS